VRLSEIDYPDGGKKTFCYNDVAPSPTVTTTTLIDNTVSPNVQISSTAVADGLGHVVQTQLTSDPDGTDNTDTTVDGLGRIWKQSNPYRSTNDPTYRVTTHTYDPLGRITPVVQTDGSIACITYSGNCTTIADEAGKMRKSCQDGLGRMTRVWEDSNAANYETDYLYDALNNLIRVDQKGGDSNPANWRTRLFTYNSLSQLLSAFNPESGTVSYSYDANGNLVQKGSPKPNQTNPATTGTVNFCYDVLNRVTSKAYNTAACPPTSAIATYSYDQGTNGIGRRTGMDDGPGLASWVYDAMGHVVSEKRTTGPVRTTSYVYNQDGSVKSVTYPSGRTINYTYSGAGRMLSAVDPTGPINYITSAKYAPQGASSSYTNGFVAGGFAGITTTNSYNSRLQPVSISAASPTASIISLCYDFHSHTSINLPPCVFPAGTGDNGNVYQIVNNRDSNRTQNFTYDYLNRIQQANSSGPTWGETFTIDPWGNLTNRGAVGGKTYYEGLRQSALPSNQLTGFGYDAAGNMTSNNGTTYKYNQEGQLTNLIINTTNDIYLYDGDGRRVKKNIGPVTCGEGRTGDCWSQ